MKREETLAAWWEGINETSRQALYLLIVCVDHMEAGKTCELRWRDSAEKRLLDWRVVSEEPAKPETQGTRADRPRGTVQDAACGETDGAGSITAVHPDGRIETVIPKVSSEQVEDWWHQLKLDGKDTLRMLVTWLQELKGRDMVRIRKLPGQLEFSLLQSRGPARADRSNGWAGLG